MVTYSQCLTYNTSASGDYFNSNNWENGLLPPNPIPQGVTINLMHPMSISQVLENNGVINTTSLVLNATGVIGGNGVINGNLINDGKISPGNFPSSTIPGVLAGVLLTDTSNINSNGALVDGIICYDGGNTVLDRGFCYGTNPNPDVSGSFISAGSGIGAFQSTISGLQSNTMYYVRAFATNSVGTNYSQQYSFQTLMGMVTGTVTDADGNVYTTRLMPDNKWWMTQNLNTGVMILGVNNPTNNSIIEKYCYNNDLNNCNNYGALYQWNEMMQYSTTQGVQGVCPVGWHLPTDTEYKNLEIALGMSVSDANDQGLRGTNQGSQMAVDEPFWTNGQLDMNSAFGSSGFNTIPVGARSTSASPFFNLTIDGSFWTSTLGGSGGAYRRSIIYYSSEVSREEHVKEQGYSVRCIMD